MKKITKILGLTFGLGLAALGTLTGAPMPGVHADVVLGNLIIEKFATQVNCGDNVTLPIGYVGSNEVKPTVYKQNGDAVQLDGNNMFSATESIYKVVYSYDSGKIEKTFYITVDLTTPVLSLNNGDNIPSNVGVGSSVTFPTLKVTDSEGNALKDAHGTEYTAEQLKNATTITVTKADGTVVKKSDSETTFKQGDTFAFAAVGTYTAKYSFKINNTTTATKEFTIKVDSNFKQNRTITFSLNSAFPSATLGKEVVLPTVTVKDVTNNLENIEAKVTITYKYIKADGSYDTPVTVEDNKVILLNAGDYIFTYSVEDYFGNKAESKTYAMRGVVDNTKPYNVMPVAGNNDPAALEGINVSYLIPSRIAKGTVVKLPAVYANDIVNSNINDLTLTRSVRRKYSSSSSIKLESLNGVTYNQNYDYKFESADTYIVRYSAVDKSGNEAYIEYEIVVMEDTFVDDAAPLVTYNAVLPNYVTTGSTVTFKAPSVVDYTDASKTLSGQKRLNVKNYYKVNGGTKVYIDYTNETTLSFDVPTTLNNGDIISIGCEVKDYAENEYDDVMTKTITVNNFNATSIAITSVDSIDYSDAKQGDVIEIEDFVVEGKNNGTLDASVIEDVYLIITNKYGNTVNYRNLTSSVVANVATYSGAKFNATSNGKYTITYVAVDKNGNYAISTQTIEVASTVEPIITLNKTSMQLELGSEAIDLSDNYAVYEDGVKVDGANVTITGANVGADYKFNPNHTGDYVVTYTYDNNGAPITKTLTITVVDTTKPTFTWTNGTPSSETPVNPQSLSNKKVYVTVPTAMDNGEMASSLIMEVTYTKSSGSTTLGKYNLLTNTTIVGTGVNKDDEGIYFLAENNGTYKVTFTATDASGNEATYNYSFKVGDLDAPHITLGDKNTALSSSAKVGEKITIDLSGIKVEDNYDGVIYDGSTNNINDDSIKNKVYITLTSPNSSTSTKLTNATGYTVEFTEVGTYTVNVIGKDAAGNSTSVKMTFEVTAEEKEEKTKDDTAIMVIAIVGSLIVLGGVVIYFFKPTKIKAENIVSKKKNK